MPPRNSTTDVFELGDLPFSRPVMLGNALDLIPPDSDVVVWSRARGIDLPSAAEASVHAGRVRGIRGHIPAKGTRTFVDGETFWREFEGYLCEIRDGAREIPIAAPKKRLRGVLRAALGRATILKVADLFLREPDSFVSLARRTPFWPSQDRDEIVSLLRLVRNRAPRSILEVGTATGGTLYLFSRVVPANATLVTIDIKQKYDPKLLKSFGRGSQRVHLLVGDSTAESTLRAAQSLLPHGVDLLFLDGDHSYEGVSADFAAYRPLVRPGGMIALHDIVDDNATRYGVPTGGYSGGVPRFWGELKDRFAHQQFVKDERQDGLGIGVVFMPS